MSTVPELIARIEAAPAGPETVACFDYDGTIISGYSATVFYDHRLRNGQLGPIELTRTLLLARRGIETPEDFNELLTLSLATWKGRPESEVEELGQKLFKTVIASRLHPEVWQIISAHHRQGHRVIIASSATRFQVEPMAIELGAEAVLCTGLEVDADGRLTGRTSGTPLWADAKAEGLREYAESVGAILDRSFAYSNGTEDIPLLEEVGFPTAISPEPALRRHAERHGWPVLDCRKRGGRPGPLDFARTAAMYGGMATGMGVGIGVGLLRRSRTVAMDVGGEIGADLALALGGVDVEVVAGHEYLFSARPCVFLINHQSGLDVPVVMKVLRGGFTGVAKKEARTVPVWGQAFMLAGVAFIDRGNTQQARDALAPAIERIRRDRISLVISPEGTRSVTPQVGRFKKGAFHIAMQAEVPIVPLVLKNTGELMWRNSQTLRPGRVEVLALPPIDTAEWTAETLGDHVAEVRQLYVDILADWPRGRTKALTTGVSSDQGELGTGGVTERTL